MSFECPALYPNTNIQNVLDVIEHLENVSLATFQRINEKIDEQRQFLSEVHQRVSVIKHSLNSIQLERKNETLLVKSSPVFPSMSKINDKPCFSMTRDRITVQDMITHRHSIPYFPNHRPKLHHHNTSVNHFKTTSNSPISMMDGIGKYHAYPISSVSELVCFNTNMRVFHNYHGVDPLSSNTFTSRGDRCRPPPCDNPLKIPPGPYSLSFNSIYECIQERKNQNDIITPFVPIMHSLPPLDLPSNLNLPNIACTTHWERHAAVEQERMPTLPCEIVNIEQQVGMSKSETRENEQQDFSQEPIIFEPLVIMENHSLSEVVQPPCSTSHNLEIPSETNHLRDTTQQIDDIQINIFTENETTSMTENENIIVTAPPNLWDSITNFTRDNLRRTVPNAHRNQHENSNTNPIYGHMIRVLDLRRIGIEGSADEENDTSSTVTDTW